MNIWGMKCATSTGIEKCWHGTENLKVYIRTSMIQMHMGKPVIPDGAVAFVYNHTCECICVHGITHKQLSL